jgi:GalNAc-alpha-(1->4)-GalNAc-alpha-(1->3)-diNAcBac-PP-undecaprenol alpha-1,4-N-acetyl-D-galactosaminyltransferase
MRGQQPSTLKFLGAQTLPTADFGGERGTPIADGSKKRLSFVIAHLGPGGAQRVVVNAANTLVERGYDVHVIVLTANSPAYWLDPRVVLQPLEGSVERIAGASNSTSANAIINGDVPPRKTTTKIKSRLRNRIAQYGPVASYIKPMVVPFVVASAGAVRSILRKLLWPIIYLMPLGRRVRLLRLKLKVTKPDAVLSFLTQTNIVTILATRGLKTRTVISERNDPRLQRHHRRVEIMRRFTYSWADVVTANSRGALDALAPFVPKDKLAFLPNLLMPSHSTEVATLQAPTIITVGRLVEQKGIDVLLSAWAQSVEYLPEWRLAIVGDGPLRHQLQARSRELEIDASIDWHGHLADPFPLLRGAKFFVMTSRFEGTPNALLEAMACGLPGIVSDASPGPCELVGLDETAGLIVPVEGVKETAEAIVRLALDETLRRQLATVARERAREHEADQALEVWLELLRCG